jgi:ribosome-binding factor A
MNPIRIQRVRELLKRQLGELIRREFPIQESGLLTVNDVELSHDLQSAVVYVGVIGPEDRRQAAVAMLRKQRKRIQGMIGRAVVLKYTPLLKFVLDESVSRGNRVLDIIDEIERSTLPHDGPSEDH